MQSLSCMKKNNIFFVVENDYFPRDIRVYNECSTLANTDKYRCFVFAPRNNKNKEKFFEIVDGNIRCFRYPHYEAISSLGLFLEYLNAFFWNAILIPVIVFFLKIDVVHVANPPDFILPSIFWLKFFNTKFVFDQHDLSLEHFKVKERKENIVSKLILFILFLLEKFTIKLSDLSIATNTSIEKYEKEIDKNAVTIVIRNSNKIQYQKIEDIPKKENKKLHLGYFGFLGSDRAAGVENLKNIAQFLKDRNIEFTFSIIGIGPGIDLLKKLLAEGNLEKYFIFYGWLHVNEAFDKIINFDFGILPWIQCERNNLHTAMKLIDYMCCGVPVCSLKLKEQLITTNEIGIHTDSFVDMAKKIVEVYHDKNRYDKLREETLNHFNKYLCWEIQAKKLIKAYDILLGLK